MKNRWRMVDFAILGLGVLSFVAYLSASPLFGLIFGGGLLLLLWRVFGFLQRRLLWKIRNRLILSGFFFVAAPLLTVTLFFISALYLILATYAVDVVHLAIREELRSIKDYVEEHVNYPPEQLLGRVRMLQPYFSPHMLLVIYQRGPEGYVPVFRHPSNIQLPKLPSADMEGHFKLGGSQYLGQIKHTPRLAVWNAQKLDVALRNLSTKLDYLQLHKPNGDVLSVEAGIQEKESGLLLPWPYRYPYLDLDAPPTNGTLRRSNILLMTLDLSRVMAKLKGMGVVRDQLNVSFFLFVFLAVSLLMVGVSFFIGGRIVRVVTRAIDELDRGTQGIRRGDFSTRIRIRSKDQLQYLGESFNEMASGIGRLLVEEKEKQRLEEELRIARSIQLKLLPRDVCTGSWFDLAAINLPASEIAGDYFDYHLDDSGALHLVVADVSGHGASAAFYMAELKGIINYLQKRSMPPATLIGECHQALRPSMDRATFITMNAMTLYPGEKRLVFARAGHTPALHYQACKGTVKDWYPQGMALGLPGFRQEKIEEMADSFGSGDILLLYSDGLSELMNREGEMLGVDRIRAILRDQAHLSAPDLRQYILDKAISFSATRSNDDDLTFILLKVGDT